MSICSEDIQPIDLNVNIMNVFKESKNENTFTLKLPQNSINVRPNISIISARKREMHVKNGNINLNINL